eukprot:g26366.t1
MQQQGKELGGGKQADEVALVPTHGCCGRSEFQFPVPTRRFKEAPAETGSGPGPGPGQARPRRIGEVGPEQTHDGGGVEFGLARHPLAPTVSALA